MSILMIQDIFPHELRNEFAYKKLDLSSIGLENTDLSGIGLENTDLSGIGLNSAGLDSIGLESTDLSGIGLNSAGLGNIGLESTELEAVSLDSAALGKADTSSRILIFHDQKILAKISDGNIAYPTDIDVKDTGIDPIYIFRIDNTDYYLGGMENRFNEEESISLEEYEYEKISVFRQAAPKHEAFAGITAYQLYNWYKDNRFCGRCGNEMAHSTKERMLHCEHCNNMVYPRINPAVIVAVQDGDKLLLTRYAGRDYKKYALVAGFTEIGESIEQTVVREVMEEVGLKVKNITYYKSQPWGFSGCLLMGFWAEVDGNTDIVLDENELAEGIWVSRDDLQVDEEEISLTREMINCFKLGIS